MMLGDRARPRTRGRAGPLMREDQWTRRRPPATYPKTTRTQGTWRTYGTRTSTTSTPAGTPTSTTRERAFRRPRSCAGSAARITGGLFGNPHSESPASRASGVLLAQARRAVLRHFNADPAEYAVIFTANATGALRLVGEAYPFTPAAGS